MQLTSIFVLSCLALTAAEFPAGSKIPEISVTDHGHPVTIRAGKAKALAIIFVSTKCEVTDSYAERLKQIAADYAGKSVEFAFVDSGSSESTAEIDAYSKAHGWIFKVFKDEGTRLADQLNAHVTPEVFLFDEGGTLKYHGRVDDSRNLQNVKSSDARAALDAMLSGQNPPVAETKAFGCTISRLKK